MSSSARDHRAHAVPTLCETPVKGETDKPDTMSDTQSTAGLALALQG